MQLELSGGEEDTVREALPGKGTIEWPCLPQRTQAFTFSELKGSEQEGDLIRPMVYRSTESPSRRGRS